LRRLDHGQVGALACNLPDQQVPVTGKRGVGRLPAVVVGQQTGKPAVGVRLQQAREHLVELQHADASRVTVAREPVVSRPDNGPQPEKERAQIHAVHVVADELGGPLGPKELHVGRKCAE